jgi:hypothetical protein
MIINKPRMASYLVATNLASLAAAVAFAGLFLRYRQRLRVAQGRSPGWPIPTVPLVELDCAFAADELGPGEEAAAVFLGSGEGVPGGTSDREAWILGVLAKPARLMFEFGTCTGRTTYLWARNSPPDAKVVTLTLPPEETARYSADRGDERRATRTALNESRFTRFRYSGTTVESKVVQLYGDSKEFDESAYLARCDLIFVDGSHAYSYVKSDSEKALRMVKPGGIILWHDYRGRSRGRQGVFRYLNELHRKLPLMHLRQTSLVAYRAPGV